MVDRIEETPPAYACCPKVGLAVQWLAQPLVEGVIEELIDTSGDALLRWSVEPLEVAQGVAGDAEAERHFAGGRPNSPRNDSMGT